MKYIFILVAMLCSLKGICQQSLYMPQDVAAAYKKGTRSPDGKPSKNYWQNKARYDIKVTLAPPDKTIRGTETITYTNHSPEGLKSLAFKLILNIHKPGASRLSPASADYLTTGIHIDKFTENGTAKNFPATSNTWTQVRLSKELAPGDSVQLSFDWHYEVSKESGREGQLDSTSFFLAYFYPRIAVLDDVNGWDRMTFTDSQEFYNDFNDYQVAVTVPKNFLVWGTGDLLNAGELLQPGFLAKFNKSFTSDEVIHVATQEDILAKNITTQNATNTWRWSATNVSDVAFCISDHYVWDAASVVVDKKTGRRASTQSAFLDKSKNFHNQVEHIRHSLDWFSNNWPGVPYPFQKSTIIQGFADMEYPMMANDSPQEDDVIQRFIAEHEVGHTYFPFYMGINEHRYGFMDEGWTTAFEYLLGIQDLGKKQATTFFKQFRVANWAMNPSEETQIPVIVPANILNGAALGINEYGKPALAYLALKDMLGDELFRKSLHGFMDSWHGKHPIPWDMFNSFNTYSGKDLSWFWKNWFFSNNYLNIAVNKVEKNKTGYAVSLKNIGGFAIPTDLLIEYADGTTDSLHQTAGIWEKNSAAATVQINTTKTISYLNADGGIYMDADDSDNSWGTKKAVAGMPALEPAKYVGTYGSTVVPLKIDITADKGNLFAQATGQDAFPLTPTAKDRFSFEAAGIVIEFDPAKSLFNLIQSGRTILFTKEK